MSRLKLPLLIIIDVVIILALSLTASRASSPLTDQDISRLSCQGRTDVSCCPVIAQRAGQHILKSYASIILINQSGYKVTLVSANLGAGRWVDPYLESFDDTVKCAPKEELSNGDSQAFSSISSHVFGGVEGHATFRIEDDAFSNFTVSWEASIIRRSAHYSIGTPSADYITEAYVDGESVYKITLGKPATFGKSSSFGWNVLTMLFIISPMLCLCYVCMVVMIDDLLQMRRPLPSDHVTPGSNSIRDGTKDGPTNGLMLNHHEGPSHFETDESDNSDVY